MTTQKNETADLGPCRGGTIPKTRQKKKALKKTKKLKKAAAADWANWQLVIEKILMWLMPGRRLELIGQCVAGGE
jgi:hypothetical protein